MYSRESNLPLCACTWHTDGLHHDDATIGICWDADRLNIEGAGVIPNAKFMSTDSGREIGNHGSIKPWLDFAKPHIAEPENHHVRTREFTDW
jgi:hypothetical protein